MFAKSLVMVVYIVLAVLVVAGGRMLWRSVPFELASYSIWGGVGLALFGLVSVVKPQHGLGIATRAQGGILVGVGIVLTATAVMWPVSSRKRTSGTRNRLDDFLPEFQFAEYHEARTRAPLSRVLEAARQVSLADMPAARVLTRLRGMADGKFAAPAASSKPLLDEFGSAGAVMLDISNPRELVVGYGGRPWVDEAPPRLGSASEFMAFSAPGHVRFVFDIRTVEEGDGVVRVSTETRIVGNDAEACRAFGRYWRIIYPGSAIIRRVWLDAIIARAERAVL